MIEGSFTLASNEGEPPTAMPLEAITLVLPVVDPLVVG
jgi:hypothetical protein